MNYLIVGLGNPGPEYSETRHNIAWSCMENFSFPEGELRWKKKFKGEYSFFETNKKKFYFLKPQTYMNLSGESVVALVQFFKIPVLNILVLHDDIDLDFGVLVLKKGGGLAGHNGLKSIKNSLGTGDFLRFRVGIGKPTRGDVSSWVLSKFNNTERKRVEELYKLVSDAFVEYFKNGFESASNKFSRKRI